MGQKDILEKKLEDFCEVFADIVNVLLFKGEKKVSPAEIKESATKSSYKADGKHHTQDRDVAKYWEIDGKKITMFGLENQTDETVAMFESDFKFVAQYFTKQRKLDEGEIKEIAFSPDDMIHVREVLELMDAMLGSDNGFQKVYNDMEEGASNMNEIFRAIKKAEYDKGHNNGQYETIMLHYQKGYLPKEEAAEELSMTEEQFLEAYKEYLASEQDPVFA